MEPNKNLSHIIFLNGTSSSGKSSIAKELEKRLDGYQVASVDGADYYVDFLPRDRTPTFSEYISGFHKYVQDLASKGRKVIVDHVLQESEWAKECADLLADYDVLLVGVHCPLDVLEQREQQRSERKWHARYQFPRVHVDKKYDLQVDTSKSLPTECADQILAHLQNKVENHTPTAQKFYAHL